MDRKDLKRRLSAILMADVVGYSRLMGQDELATLHTLTAYREVFRKQVGDHDGRVVNTPGDSVLAEFGSVVNCVACAVEVQREVAGKTRSCPTNAAWRRAEGWGGCRSGNANPMLAGSRAGYRNGET